MKFSGNYIRNLCASGILSSVAYFTLVKLSAQTIDEVAISRDSYVQQNTDALIENQKETCPILAHDTSSLKTKEPQRSLKTTSVQLQSFMLDDLGRLRRRLLFRPQI